MIMYKTCEYKDKYFSILGDSVSTFEGVSQPLEHAFYKLDTKLRSKVCLVRDTWWWKVIAELGGKLLVNNSISGSRVTRHPSCEQPTYGCSDERTGALGVDGKTPDVIMVFMGLNDWSGHAKISSGCKECKTGSAPDLSVFPQAYGVMLDKLKNNYPTAQIWCLTLPVSTCSSETGFEFTYGEGKWHISEYCKVIKDVATAKGCKVIDLYGEPFYDSLEGCHPNLEGMQSIAQKVLSKI